MKGLEIINLYNALLSVSNVASTKLSLAVIKNKKIFEGILQDIKNLDSQAVLKDFDIERMALANDMAKKDAEGKPIIENNSFIMEDMDKWNAAYAELKEKFKDDIAKAVTMEQKIKDFLEKEFDLDLVKVEEKDLPDNLDVAKIETLTPIIK